MFLLFSPILSADMGALLFNGNCATCHHIKETLSAPSLESIQKRYKEAFPLQQDFVSYMSNWVVSPNEETALMHDMIDKFGIMPTLVFEKSTVEEIAKAIYKGSIEATTH